MTIPDSAAGPGDAAVAAGEVQIILEPVALEQVLDGAPSTGFTTITTLGDLEVGVWEMTVGSMRDVETDEVFVVIAGRATVSFDADDRVMDLSAGSVARLSAGERTVWTVTETIRKVYLA
ncbi:cupin domain-containing protein [Frigoribacterium sp. UYMn621]|uniref:cupin domain-containing protein n=1 Tax=Frigoribacterium sp. UYMn621 TaxID=3156343 RepID=UPI00339A5CEE